MKACKTCQSDCTPNGIAAGYATSPDGRTLCYDCANAEQLAILADPSTVRSVAYVKIEPRPNGARSFYGPTALTDWTGRSLAAVTSYKSTAMRLFGSIRCVLWTGTARTPDGSTWRWSHYETDFGGQIAHLRR